MRGLIAATPINREVTTMRACWMFGLALLLPALASAGSSGPRDGARFSPPSAPTPPSGPHYISPGAALSNPPVTSNPQGGGSGWHGHRYRGGGYYYPLFYAGSAPSADDANDQPPPRTQYVPVPYPVVVAPPPPPVPKTPPPIVRYASNGEPIDIPKGARVSSGSVYKYQQGGESVYTDSPPAGAHATLLFDYTEAVAPAPQARR
ncbi:MAG: hypothetical protein JSS03_08070 [Proteobacteria bacterium]|nr:hypothetical protein [Pseudomonadota bacterium]